MAGKRLPSAHPSGISERIREDGSRLIVSVRVTPRARRNALAFEDGILRARLMAPPVEGAANAALLGLLAERLGLPKRAVALVRGETSREKVISIEGISAEELSRRLASS